MSLTFASFDPLKTAVSTGLDNVATKLSGLESGDITKTIDYTSASQQAYMLVDALNGGMKGLTDTMKSSIQKIQ